MSTPHPEPLTALAGAPPGPGNRAQAHRQHQAWTADPDLIRRLQVGQACYIHHGAATFVQVARPRPSPLTLLPPPAPGPSPVQVPAPRREAEPGRQPGPQPNPVPASLDDVFGPGGTP